MTPIILASASPRRRELLIAMGIPHDVAPSTVDESLIAADHPRTFALRAAYAKAMDVARASEEGRWVLAADTVVTMNLILYGKPVDRDHARQILRVLSGQRHDVITAVALTCAGSPTAYLRAETTRVVFRELTEAEIDTYVATGEPMDKAGAYGIQGAGGELVSAIEGDYYNVVGLPCRVVAELLEEAALDLKTTLPPPPERWR